MFVGSSACSNMGKWTMEPYHLSKFLVVQSSKLLDFCKHNCCNVIVFLVITMHLVSFQSRSVLILLMKNLKLLMFGLQTSLTSSYMQNHYQVVSTTNE